MSTQPLPSHNIKVNGSPLKGLIGATIGFFFGSAAVSLFGPSATRLKEAMDLDPTLVGMLVAIPSLSGSILRIPFGAWVDTTGGKKPFTILMVLSVIGMLGLTWLINGYYPDHMHGYYPLVLIFGLLSGCGIATFSVGTSQISYWYPRAKQGSPLATYAGIGTLAPGIFALIIPLYLARWSFQSVYVSWSVYLIVGTVLYWWLGKNAPYFQGLKHGMTKAEAISFAASHGEDLVPAGNVKQSLVTSAKIKYTWILVSLYFTTFGGFLALTSWYPTIWKQVYEFDSIKAGVFTAIFSILSALLRIVAGPISDKIGGKRLCMLSMWVLLGSIIGIMFCKALIWTIVFTIIIAAAMGFNNAAVFKLVPRFVPQAIGGASGWVGGIGAFSGFVLPTLMGWMVSQWGTSWYLLGFVVFAVLALFNILLLSVSLKENKTIKSPSK